MTASKKLRRLALVTIVLSATGCKTGSGLSSLSLNPFSPKASAGEKIAITEVTTPEDAPQTDQPTFTGRVASAGAKTRDLLVGAFTFNRETTQASELDTPDDSLSLSKTPAKLGPEVYVANGQLWESSGSFERAMDNYAKALEVDADNGPALGAIARLNDRQNNLEKSAEYFQRAIKADPSEPTLYNDYGLVLARQKNFESAVEQIQKAIAISPGNKRFANNLATVYMDAGDSAHAMTVLSGAHDPAVAHYNMAYLNFKRQQVGEARSQLETALQIDPNLEPARNLLDKLGGTQIAQAAKDTMNAATSIGEGVQSVSHNVQETYQSITGQNVPVTRSISSGLSDDTDTQVPAIQRPPAQTLAPPVAPPTIDPVKSAASIQAQAAQVAVPAADPPAPTTVVPESSNATTPSVTKPAATNDGGGWALPPSIGG